MFKQNKKRRVDRKISLIQLIGLSFAFFCSIRNIPQVAAGGMSSILWMTLSILIFVIPIALITTEMATGWSQRGGAAIWAKVAFGKGASFIVSWLLWVQMFLGMTIMLVVFSTMTAYAVGDPLVYSFVMKREVRLSNEPFYILLLSLVIYWFITIINIYFKIVGKNLINIGSIIGIYLPFIVLLVCGIAFITQQSSLGNWNNINNLDPEFMRPTGSAGVLSSNINSLELFSQIMWIFIGLEIASTRANEIENPKRNYPLAMLIVLVLMVIVIFATGFIFAAIVPYDQITLQSAVMLPFIKIFSVWQMNWMTNIMAICLAIGTFTHLNSWVLGPSNAMYVAAKEGCLPPLFQKTNKNNAPVMFMLIQAIAINVFSIVYFVFEISGAANSFGILLNETIIIYCLAYFIMLASYLKLKYTQPNVKRSFTIPGGKIGTWIFSIIGFIAVSLAIIMTFFQNQPTWTLFLVQDVAVYLGVTIGMITIPLIISKTKKFKNNSWTIMSSTNLLN